ncbi:MAG TPA: hypothetical protein VFJ98_09820 [Mycobacteriales bacterium]|nr:hypothetical protein [Mycobacteriales bacterium]
MTVAPLPATGGVHLDPRGDGRALRVSAHPELALVTISVWREDRCVATHQVPSDDVPDLVKLLTEALLRTPPADGAARRLRSS